MEYNFSVRKRGNKWHLVCSYKTADGWKQKTKGGFALRKEAISWKGKEALIKEIEKAEVVSPTFSNITLRGFLEFYIKEHPAFAYNTIDKYRTAINGLPQIADKPIKDISLLAIIGTLRALQNTPGKLKAARTVLKTLFSSAVMYNAVAKNPLTDYKFPQIESGKENKRLRVFTDEQIADVMKHGADDEPSLIMAIAAATGMRGGEILGLKWSDIDFATSRLTVNKQWKRIGNENGKTIFGWGNVKNKNGNRTLFVPPSLMRILIEYKANHPINISGRIATINAPGQLRDRISRRYPNHSMHDFRHTFGTRLSLTCPNVSILAATLGDSEGTVVKTYLNYSEEMRKAADTHIAEMFS